MPKVPFPKYIFGLHEPGGEHLMEEKGKIGWILFTHGLGHDPDDTNGQDYRRWSDRGFGIIARLNHGYGSAGTIPQPQHYAAFARRVRNFVQNSHGCSIWVIGNEMNHGQERPDGQIIAPDRYAACYKQCWEQIHGLAGHKKDQVAIGAVAPWNNTTAYPGNESGDWVKYFLDIIKALRGLDCPIDAITVHAYTHGHDPNLVFSERKMSPPFQNYRYHFRCYRDFMDVIPQDLRNVPVYLTEADQDEPWENANRGWVRNAYKEINDWNNIPDNQQIRALILYRWPNYDKWVIETKGGVHDDFRAAMDHEYTWQEVKRPMKVNGYTLKGPFLRFYDQWGVGLCGMPISNQSLEDELRTQYFERLVLQRDATGKTHPAAIGSEIRSLRQTTSDAQQQIKVLQRQTLDLREQIEILERMAEQPASGTTPGQGEGQIIEIVRPLWENIVHALPVHPTKSYSLRVMGTVRYLTITHSAVPGSVTAQRIARFHAQNMQWPGIGYHFYIDDKGRIFQTNELTTICYHVGKWDPVSVGICVGGNFTKVIPTSAQIVSAAHLVAWLLQELGLSFDAIRGKGEFIDTQSPGYQWLEGQKWKNILLAEVQKAQQENARLHPLKALYHYLLFWQDDSVLSQEEWLAAKDYIGRFRVTHGVSVNDAQLAEYVTIIGGTPGVDGKTEQYLLDAGCRVERVAGKSPSENAKVLTAMAQWDQRFLNYTG